MKQAFITRRFQAKTLATIQQANEIISEYQAGGYTLTLRQLYYQMVARGMLENNEANYEKLGATMNTARLAGYVDWEAIEDRTRELKSPSFWESPQVILDTAARAYRIDLWANQPCYVEVWVEKEALAGVVSRACDQWRVPYFSCRGYVSASEQYKAADRLSAMVQRNGRVKLIHLGDHDPSGIDMSRDIQERLGLMMGDCYEAVEFERIALNIEQVKQYNPPPNPAKENDKRFEQYQKLYGKESWELDALTPDILIPLIIGAIIPNLDRKTWDRDLALERQERDSIANFADSFLA
jgi:hypothetical protein